MAENKTNQNIYRVGDWVYCETSLHLPYCIRKIEELVKTQNGNVEARVTCAFRRRDISLSLLNTLDKNPFFMITQFNANSDIEDDLCHMIANSANNLKNEQQVSDEITEMQKQQLKHRELFYSKCTEQIQVSIIRGKCNVYLYSTDLDTFSYYSNNEDTFYYQLTYDPNQKKLLSDEGKIRVGLKYQAEIPPLLINESNETEVDVDELLWNTNECTSSDEDFNKFIMITQSIGTYARALDCNNNEEFQKPNLILSAANASRDITLFNAYKCFHDSKYNLTTALLNFIPVNGSGPILCKDEIENWSINEINLFEEGLDKFGKNFNQIHKELLNYKSLNSIIEYYYLWKTTERYVPRRRLKETQNKKLPQVYIPNYQKQHQAQIVPKDNRIFTCQSCSCIESSSWYLANISPETKSSIQYQSSTQYLQSYNQSNVVLTSNQQQSALPLNSNNNQQQQTNIKAARLCLNCWIYWKKYGSFKYSGSKDTDKLGAEKRPERLSVVRLQIHKCEFDECGKEFKLRSQLTKHCLISHALTIRGASSKPLFKPLKSFYLYSTPITKASRLLFLNLKKTGKNPFKPIDFNKLKSQWYEEPHNIREILGAYKPKTVKKSLKLNDHKIEHQNINTNLLMKYFSMKTKSYNPINILFPKPSEDIILKFFQNLNLQSRKRPADSTNLDTTSDDSCTPVKRRLLNKSVYKDAQNKISPNIVDPKFRFKNLTSTSFNSKKNTNKKGIASSDQEFYLFINESTKQKRQGIINSLNYDLKKLAKNPFKIDSRNS